MQLECCYNAYSDELFPSIIPFFPAVLIGHRTHPCSGFCVQASVSCAHILGYLHKLWFFALFISVILLELTVSISTESYNTHTHTHIRCEDWDEGQFCLTSANDCDSQYKCLTVCMRWLLETRGQMSQHAHREPTQRPTLYKTELCLKRGNGLPDLNIFERFSLLINHIHLWSII